MEHQFTPKDFKDSLARVVNGNVMKQVSSEELDACCNQLPNVLNAQNNFKNR